MLFEEALAAVRESWMHDALCHEYPLRLFYPERGEPCVQAKAICARCLVRAPCLRFALRDPDAFGVGIWGGTSARERRKLGRAAA